MRPYLRTYRKWWQLNLDARFYIQLFKLVKIRCHSQKHASIASGYLILACKLTLPVTDPANITDGLYLTAVYMFNAETRCQVIFIPCCHFKSSLHSSHRQRTPIWCFDSVKRSSFHTQFFWTVLRKQIVQFRYTLCIKPHCATRC